MDSDLTINNLDLPDMNVDDVANRLRLSASSVRRLVAAGALSHHRVGGLLRFSGEDLREFSCRTRVASAAS